MKVKRTGKVKIKNQISNFHNDAIHLLLISI
jgi:hypothetical protein